MIKCHNHTDIKPCATCAPFGSCDNAEMVKTLMQLSIYQNTRRAAKKGTVYTPPAISPTSTTISYGVCRKCKFNPDPANWPPIPPPVVVVTMLKKDGTKMPPKPPVDWKIKGPPLWKEFHDKTKQPRRNPGEFNLWLNGFMGRLGCGNCKNRFMAWVKENQPRTESVAALIQWGIDAHNAVNVDLGKPPWEPTKPES